MVSQVALKVEGFHAKIRCNLNDISYLSETQKNNFQFLYLQLLLYSFLFSIYNHVFLKKNTFPANSSFRAFRL